MLKILVVFGTRPEAIKLCPVLLAMGRLPDVFNARVCVTAQHRAMLDQVLETFGVVPHHDLDLMRSGQTLFQSTSRIIAALEQVFETERPDMVLVQGDTTTTLCGALAGFYARVPVGHIEAGLRTGDLAQPFPEEMNRVVTGRLTALHFAATESAACHLRREGAPSESIVVTGNTAIDAVLFVRDELDSKRLSAPPWPWLDRGKKLVVVTAHRRESFGEGFERISQALRQLASRGDVQIAYPVHPNPNVQGPVNKYLAGNSAIVLLDPLAYVPFVDLMRRAHILITDSGGVQEEGPSLGRPILVLREKTERPEAVDAGTVRLVGTNPEAIVAEAGYLLDDDAEWQRRSRVHNPYGDGRASGRILDAIRSFFSD